MKRYLRPLGLMLAFLLLTAAAYAAASEIGRAHV